MYEKDHTNHSILTRGSIELKLSISACLRNDSVHRIQRVFGGHAASLSGLDDFKQAGRSERTSDFVIDY
jgi:hypothetical protein